jgi:predicted Zn-dependent protease with MMP-like domain
MAAEPAEPHRRGIVTGISQRRCTCLRRLEATVKRLSRDEFEEIVDQALATIPPAFSRYLENVIVEVEDMPDVRTCADVDVDDPRELLGLYHGVPLIGRSVDADVQFPDRISIYQRNIERVCDTPQELIEQVRTTVLHEIGHHFGLDEDDLDEVGYG